MSASPRMLLAGTIIRGMLEQLEERFGRELVWQVIGTLPEEQRRECLDAGTARVVHADSCVAAFQAVGARVGIDIRPVHAAMVRHMAERTFASIWRVLLHFTTDAALVARVPLIFSKAYPSIRVDSEQCGPGHVAATVRNWPDIDDLSFEGIGISVEVVLRLGGRSEVRVKRERRAGLVTYTARWPV